MLHLDEGTVYAWLDGELSADDAERAARHAAECAECAALVAEARGVMAASTRIVSALDAGPIGVAPRTQRAAPPNRRRWYRFALTPARMSIAATILVAAGVTLTVRHANVGSDVVATGRMVDSPLPAASPAATPAAAAPADRIADSIAVVPAPRAQKETPAPPSVPATAAKSQNSAITPLKKLDAVQTVVGGAVGDNKVQAEDKARAGLEPSPRTAPKPGADAPARVDSLRAKDEEASARARVLERRESAVAGGVAQPQQTAATTDRDSASTFGAASQNCYHLDIDSTAWRRALPSAFALGPVVSGTAASATAAAAGAPSSGFRAQNAAQPAMRAILVTPGNVVHALTPSGRVDSLVVGDWRPSGPSLVTVHFAAADQRKPVTLLLAANSGTAQLISGNRTDSVRVVRITCAR